MYNLCQRHPADNVQWKSDTDFTNFHELKFHEKIIFVISNPNRDEKSKLLIFNYSLFIKRYLSRYTPSI